MASPDWCARMTEHEIEATTALRAGELDDASAVVGIMRVLGMRALMGADGCFCGRFEVRGYHVDWSCRKSDSTLRIYGNTVDMAGLEMVAPEALRQSRQEDSFSDVVVRFCSYEDDHKFDTWHDSQFVPGNGACIYCGRQRDSRQAYLCGKCLSGETKSEYVSRTIADDRDYSRIALDGLHVGEQDV